MPCSSFVVVTRPQTLKTKVVTTFFTYFSRGQKFDLKMRDFSQFIPFQHSRTDLPKMAVSSSLFPSHSAVSVPCGYLRVSITWTCAELTSLHMGRTFLLVICLVLSYVLSEQEPQLQWLNCPPFTLFVSTSY